MGITVYSLVVSIVFYNLALIAVFLLRRSPAFRARHTVTLLLFITVLGAVRLLVPVDFDAYVIRSYQLIPAVEDFLKRPMFGALTPGFLLLAIWLCGSIFSVVKDIRVQRRFDRSMRSMDFVEKPRVVEIAAEYGDRFAVLMSPQLGMPYTSGLLHPVIYLPDVDLSDEEWRLVLRHEIAHIRSHDNLKKLFFLAVEAIFWWNPLAHFSAQEINALIELRCDAKVTAEMNDQERLDYAALLRKLLTLRNLEKAPATVSAMAGGQWEMRLRFESLGRSGDTKRPQYILYALLILIFVLSYFVVVQPARFPTEGLDTDETGNTVSIITDIDFSTNESQIVFEGGKYHLYINGEFVGSLYEEELPDISENTIPIVGGT